MSKINPGNIEVDFQVARLTANLKGGDLSLPSELLTGLPYPFGNALEHVNQIAPPRDYVGEAAEAVRRGEDPDQLLALANASALRPKVGEILAHEANLEYIDRLNASADLIIRTLRTEVFEPIIDTLTTFQEEHDGHCSLEAAIRAEDFRLAAAIRAAEDAVGGIMSLHETRQLLHSPDGPQGGENLFMDSAAWALEPDAFDAVGAASKLDERRVPNMHRLQWWMDLIEAGYTPHYPTYDEWQQLRKSEAFTGYAASKTEPTTPAFAGGIKMSRHN